MRCATCQHENGDDVRFCSRCGSPLGTPCERCEHPNPPESRYCVQCGHRIDDAPREGEDRGPVAESERKHVTVLFSDLSGYTEMTEKLDPEEVKALTQHIFQKVSAIVAKYDGSIERYVGDSAMGHWVKERIGRPLTMHSGINSGLVVTAPVEPESKAHGLTGLTVNLGTNSGDTILNSTMAGFD